MDAMINIKAPTTFQPFVKRFHSTHEVRIWTFLVCNALISKFAMINTYLNCKSAYSTAEICTEDHFSVGISIYELECMCHNSVVKTLKNSLQAHY